MQKHWFYQCFGKAPLQKHWFYQCFPSRGAENIGKTNKNHKNQDFQTMGWRFQVLVWKSWFLWFLLVLPMFSAPRAEKHWQHQCFVKAPVQKHWFYQCFGKAPMQKHWFYQCFPSRGAENIGKTNKNHKNQDFQTMGWRFQVLVWKSWFLWFLLVLPMFCEGTLAKTLVLPMFGGGALAKTLVLPMFYETNRPWRV